jgi:Ca-activated chloride channel family protein
MDLTREATKEIFQILDDDEYIGVIAFDSEMEIVEILKPKSEINQEQFVEKLETIDARGGTNMEIGMEKAIQMLLRDPNTQRNKRIIFITDDCPNIGKSEHGLREMAEQAFNESNGTLGITYIGVGLSFNATVSKELSKVKGTTIFSANSSTELKKTLVEDFNYIISPVAFDVSINLLSNGYAIETVYGTDADAAQSDKLLNFRTLTSSRISEEGVKGCAILIKLKETPKNDDDISPFLKVEIQYTPFRSVESERKVFVANFVHSDALAIRKAIALSRYFDTLKELLPETSRGSLPFTNDDKAKLDQLKAFLTQSNDIRHDLSIEIESLERLILL